MAADILLYDADIVPVGKDQAQHLEMTRDVANRLNNQVGDVLIPPATGLQEDTMLVPGTDGQKMSKSRDNIVNLFLDDKKLRKQIMKIQTDSTPLEEPKDPDSCNLFALYKLVANEDQIAEMRGNYLGGNYGYGHAKQAFFELLIDKFAKERELYNHYMDNLNEIDKALNIGTAKARKVAQGVLTRVREKLGY